MSIEELFWKFGGASRERSRVSASEFKGIKGRVSVDIVGDTLSLLGSDRG